jgi:hypothetical protein
VTERGLPFDRAVDRTFDDGGAMFGRPSRPSLVPLPPPAGPAAGPPEDLAADLRDFNELLILLLVSWVQRAREQQLTRRAAGLPAIDVSWENAIVDQYASRLGSDGAEIALALLARSRPAVAEQHDGPDARSRASRPAGPGNQVQNRATTGPEVRAGRKSRRRT